MSVALYNLQTTHTHTHTHGDYRVKITSSWATSSDVGVLERYPGRPDNTQTFRKLGFDRSSKRERFFEMKK